MIIASLLPEFEYDIFISYRQKDNAYDGWVTEFVARLRKELEATFKESVTVYFDQNIQDGLLESHHVNKSLEGKLRCLVFIPILSHTYCDPNCYAWKEELCAFNRLAQSQSMGRDIQLLHGNVASRILPVQIHELDPADQAAFERETGGPLRSIPFIYKEAGVNRPLRPADDRGSNLNNTEYRNQVNKVANAIREIIQAIQSPVQKSSPAVRQPSKSTPIPRRLWPIALLVPVTFVLYLLLSQHAPGSIAVLPFQNQTSRDELNVYSIGMASTATSLLSTSNKFNSVSSLSAVLIASQNNKASLPDYGKMLGADFLLTGFYQLRGEKIHVVIEFMEASSGSIQWSKSLEWDMKNLAQLEYKIRKLLVEEFHLDDPGGQQQTASTDAYAHFQRGQEMLMTAYGDSINGSDPFSPVIREHAQAVRLDSFFIDAWTEMIAVECFLYQGRKRNDSFKAEVNSHLRTFKRHFPEDSWQKELVLGEYHLHITEDADSAIHHFHSVLRSNPHNEHAAYGLSRAYGRKLNIKEAIHFSARLLQINRTRAGNWTNLGLLLAMNNDPGHSVKAHLKAWELSQSRNLGRAAMMSAVDAGRPLAELPQSLRDAIKGEYTLWERMIARDWEGAKRASREINDRLMTAMVCRQVGQVDSAKHWVRLALEHGQADSSTYFMIMGDKDKALASGRETNQKPTEESTLNARSREVLIFIFLKDYEEATNRLRQLIRDYPGIDHWSSYLHIPLFDDILSTHQPFQELVRQPPPPPFVDIESLIEF